MAATYKESKRENLVDKELKEGKEVKGKNIESGEGKEGKEEKYKDDHRGWTCGSCTFRVEVSTKLTPSGCPVCQTPRAHGSWQCKVCTFVNAGKISRMCDVCRSPNENIERIEVVRYFDDTWDCLLCTAHNKRTRTTCIGCEIGAEQMELSPPLALPVSLSSSLSSNPSTSSALVDESAGYAQYCGSKPPVVFPEWIAAKAEMKQGDLGGCRHCPGFFVEKSEGLVWCNTCHSAPPKITDKSDKPE